MVKKLTFDIESDWGGRTNGTLGIRYGLPKILEVMRAYRKKGLFFVSTELLTSQKEAIKNIFREGHQIGSHGHFHVVWNNPWRAEEDRRISNILLTALTGHSHFEYRAPKFSHQTSSVYSKPYGHFGLLKNIWFGGKRDGIFYMHPFDIVDCQDDAPNPLSRIWYSHSRNAYKAMVDIIKAS